MDLNCDSEEEQEKESSPVQRHLAPPPEPSHQPEPLLQPEPQQPPPQEAPPQEAEPLHQLAPPQQPQSAHDPDSTRSQQVPSSARALMDSDTEGQTTYHQSRVDLCGINGCVLSRRHSGPCAINLFEPPRQRVIFPPPPPRPERKPPSVPAPPRVLPGAPERWKQVEGFTTEGAA